MGYNKKKYIQDLDLVKYSRSKYIKNKDSYINKQYNSLYLKDIVCDTGGRVYGVCDCMACGEKNIVTVIQNLISLKTKSCGCSRSAGSGFNSKYNSVEYIGKTFGGLTVVGYEFMQTPEYSGVFWDTICNVCGKHKKFKAPYVVRKHPSCGCTTELRNNKYLDQNWVGKTVNGTLVYKVNGQSKDGCVWTCKCRYCGNTFQALARKIVSQHTKSCGCISESIGIIEIKRWLMSNNISFIQEYKCSELLSQYGFPLRFDFAIMQNEKVIAFIEYDGEQHYSVDAGFGDPDTKYDRYMDILDSDTRKNRYASSKGIALCRIRYSRNTEAILLEVDKFIHNLLKLN